MKYTFTALWFYWAVAMLAALSGSLWILFRAWVTLSPEQSYLVMAGGLSWLSYLSGLLSLLSIGLFFCFRFTPWYQRWLLASVFHAIPAVAYAVARSPVSEGVGLARLLDSSLALAWLGVLGTVFAWSAAAKLAHRAKHSSSDYLVLGLWAVVALQGLLALNVLAAPSMWTGTALATLVVYLGAGVPLVRLCTRKK